MNTSARSLVTRPEITIHDTLYINIIEYSTDKYKWEKIDICMNCYKNFFTPSVYSVEFDKVSDDTIERIISG